VLGFVKCLIPEGHHRDELEVEGPHNFLRGMEKAGSKLYAWKIRIK
jgi:hypothetical protein